MDLSEVPTSWVHEIVFVISKIQTVIYLYLKQNNLSPTGPWAGSLKALRPGRGRRAQGEGDPL